jgi:hypothetical protein
VPKESPTFVLPHLLGFFKADRLRRQVNLKRVVGCLCAGNLVRVNNARGLCDSHGKGFDVRDSFVKRSVGFRVTNSLIEQVGEVIE